MRSNLCPRCGNEVYLDEEEGGYACGHCGFYGDEDDILTVPERMACGDHALGVTINFPANKEAR